MTSDPIIEALAALVAKVDAADAACPIRGKFSRDVCPKCSATTRDPCGPVISAEYGAVQGIRSILRDSQKRLTSESHPETADVAAESGDTQ